MFHETCLVAAAALFSGEPVIGLISGPGEPSGPIERGAIKLFVTGSRLRFAGEDPALAAAFPLRPLTPLLVVGEAVNGDPTLVEANGDLGGASCVICTPRSTGLVDSMADMRTATLWSELGKRKEE